MIDLKIHATPELGLDLASLDLAPAQAILADLPNSNMSGWFQIAQTVSQSELDQIKAAAQQIQSDSDYLVCIGIGGSYLGHRAIIDALGNRSHTQVLYAGHNLSQHTLDQLIAMLGDADFSVNVISKSGTTLEPALAFDVFKQKLITKYGEAEAYRRIYATTDSTQGTLHDEAVQYGYHLFRVPDNVGGRYSVFTAVGLLPLAVADINIDQLLAGATATSDYTPALQYATIRHLLYASGHDVEVLATFEPELQQLTEWWKQLFGESEGKNQQGIFPASAIFTTDLHSLGQYLQQGRPNIYETFLHFQPITDTDFTKMNDIAYRATVTAHAQHHPVIELHAGPITAPVLGELIYFFEVACAISAQLHGVNPFDQPGVETYKAEMRRLMAE